MSNNDKTKQKLMESMRTTKEGSNKKIDEADPKQNITPKDEIPVKKEKKQAATKKVAKNTQKPSVDPFQSASRVWPD
ncbi:MAG: hypothetical protein OQK46_05775 [Gammaproteobacteria bacterium]|nr:hypothetical protein [Gammaproteobacteria bacterium]